MTTKRLAGRVALVTGGARGQGEAEARLFAAEGARVVVTDVLDEEGAKLAGEIGEPARYLHLDVSSEDGWAAALRETLEAFGRLDILVNNAGIVRTGLLEKMSRDDYMEIVVNGRENVSTSVQNKMPAFGLNPNVMCFIDDIYAYLKARADGVLGRGRPDKEAKPPAARERDHACLR